MALIDLLLESNQGEVLTEIERYKQRKLDGIEFADYMNARLLLAGYPDDIKYILDNEYSYVQFHLEGGKWKSASRGINSLIAHEAQTQADIDAIQPDMVDLNAYRVYIETYINNYISTSYI